MKWLIVILCIVAPIIYIYSLARYYSPRTKVFPEPTPAYQQKQLSAVKLWSLIQDWRVSQGLQPYIKDQRLCKIAEDRVDDGVDFHKGFIEKYNNSNYPYAMQENQTGAASHEDALDRWLNSPPHRATLEKPYTHSCVAVQRDWAVQIFSSFLTN